MRYMKAAAFIELGRIALQERPVPPVSTREARIRITTICKPDQIEEAYDLRLTEQRERTDVRRQVLDDAALPGSGGDGSRKS